jgi:predicted SnoaL-like aldol condensation-catalyzing enzyme
MKASEVSETVARRAIEEIWNQHNLDAIDVLYAPDYVTHDLGAQAMSGREGLKWLVSQAIAAAPNARVSIELVLAQGDKIAMRYTASNGHGAAATGVLVMRIIRGQIRESWSPTRMVELLQRVGSAAN